MADIDIDVKNELKALRGKVRKLDTVMDYNTISYSEFIQFVFNLAKKFDKRLDDLEAKLDAIEKAFQESLERFPPV